MGLIAASNTHRPTQTVVDGSRCKKFDCKATGKAEWEDVLVARARASARIRARAEMARAILAVRFLECPENGGCDECRFIRFMATGFGTEYPPPRKVGGKWRVKVTTWRTYELQCRCRRRRPSRR